MARRICAFLILALLAGTAALAGEGEAGYQTLACPRQGFTTACEAGLRWQWDDVNGLVIHTGQTGGAPCVMIRVTASGGTDFEGYFSEILTPHMQRTLGDRLLAVSPFDTYALGNGVALPGVMYTYLDGDGRRQVLFRLFDARWVTNVCYTLRYSEAEADDALRALGIAVTRFRMDGDASGEARDAAPDAGFLPAPGAIRCPQQGYTAVCGMACATHWDPGDGLYVYLGAWGRTPYVLVRVAPGEIDIPAFFRDAVTPAMRERYGDDLLDEIDCGRLTIGARRVTGFGYRYRQGDGVVYMLRVLENRDGCNLSCIVKYPEGDEAAREAAMAALTSIADSFRRDGA